MELSLCMIVRNEEEKLGRCLESVQKAMDEIVVVDTGSTDATKEVARRFTNRIYDFEWIDDFAAARNTAFSYATKSFLMWLDADDVMEPQACEKLRQFKAQLDDSVDAVMMPYECALRRDGTPALVFERERIVRRAAGFAFAGMVHEAMSVSGNVIHADIPVRHTGAHSVASSQRNLAIYEKGLARGMQMGPRERYYYARELMACGYTERAEQAFAEFLQMDGWEENRLDAFVQRGHCLARLGRAQEARRSFLESMTDAQPRAQALCAMGESLLEEGKPQAAVFWYRAALEMQAPKASGAFVYPDLYTYVPAIQLCVCYDRMGEAEMARQMNELALSFRPGDEAAMRNRAYFREKLENTGENIQQE